MQRFTAANQPVSPGIEEQTESIRGNYQGFGLGARAIDPRFYGSVGFTKVRQEGANWSDFTHDEFTIPRIMYRADQSRASLSLFASRTELGSEALRQQYAARLCGLAKLDVGRTKQPTCDELRLSTYAENPDRFTWNQQVEEACELLQAGRLEKVVLARELILTFNARPDVGAILRRLLARQDGSVCFAFRRGASTFLGATPERLVAKRGSKICTEALAGSAAKGDSEGMAALLHGDKDRLEHALVVREIVARLSTLGCEISVPGAPELRQFGPLVHLRTSIEARKLGAPHVLALGHHLHPTPAVGGVPADRALEFIRQHEPFDRGRYASPVGWFDCNGDGELVVALRSGLIRGREVRLYAGAGLVIGSDPEAEWRETVLKFRSFLDALGLQLELDSDPPMHPGTP